jgi:hypothetical protein
MAVMLPGLDLDAPLLIKAHIMAEESRSPRFAILMDADNTSVRTPPAFSRKSPDSERRVCGGSMVISPASV